MKNTRFHNAFVSMMACALALTAWAQRPTVEHAQLGVRGGGDLQGAISAMADPGWIAYSEPAFHPMDSWDDGVQYLEGRPKLNTNAPLETGSSKSFSMVVLLRVLGGRVSKIRVSGPERKLDAGGLPFVWVNDVSQTSSLHVLSAVAEQGIVTAPASASLENVKSFASSHATTEVAMLAIALHSAPEATTILRSFTTDRNPVWARERAAFWLANERGDEGYRAVKGMLDTEHDDELRSRLVFDLTLVIGSWHGAAVDELIALARKDTSAKVRKQAQFWLAQQVNKGKSDDPRIPDTLRQQASSDPDAAIRKSAVFALSRLPEPQATSELIRVASTSTDPSTRREAVFWLGQSKDTHALDYLEKLTRQ